MDRRHVNLTETEVQTLPRITEEAPVVAFAAPEQATDHAPFPAAKRRYADFVPWDVLGVAQSVGLFVLWPLALAALIAIAPTPPPVDPNAAPTLLESIGALFQLGVLVTAGLAALRNRGLAPVAAFGTGCLGLVAHIGCAAGGHVAPTAGWWIGGLAIITAATAASAVAVRSSLD